MVIDLMLFSCFSSVSAGHIKYHRDSNWAGGRNARKNIPPFTAVDNGAILATDSKHRMYWKLSKRSIGLN